MKGSAAILVFVAPELALPMDKTQLARGLAMAVAMVFRPESQQPARKA